MENKTADDLFVEIKTLFDEFEKEHHAGTKVGQKRARKAIGEIKKLVTEYRKASVEESK